MALGFCNVSSAKPAILITAGDFRTRPRSNSTCTGRLHGGRGGKAEPLAGASASFMGNNLPEGVARWQVDCARREPLIHPDSKLYIIPFGGGKARLMNCNTSLMKSGTRSRRTE